MGGSGANGLNVIHVFRSVFLSELSSHLQYLLVKLLVAQSVCHCQFCLSPSISHLYGTGNY